MREPALLVQFDDGGLGIRSQLSGSGAEGVRGLQGMASLNPPVAVLALPDVDVELPVDRLTRDLHLELLGHMRFVERAAARGAEAVRSGERVGRHCTPRRAAPGPPRQGNV